MKKAYLALILLLVLLAGCGPSPSPTPVPTALPSAVPPTATPLPSPEEVLFVAIIWHQHQPIYYQDPQTGLYAKPWVRLHAAKDYVDMAALVEKYPQVHVTFNLTPSLIRQLDDVSAGARDLYWAMTEVPASS